MGSSSSHNNSDDLMQHLPPDQQIHRRAPWWRLLLWSAWVTCTNHLRHQLCLITRLGGLLILLLGYRMRAIEPQTATTECCQG